MSTVVMNNLVFECSELFKNASAARSQDTNQQSRLQKYSDEQQQTVACPNDLRRSYTSLVNLIEQHRKLDRSVSEPTSRYKTELCRPFEESGSCKYGDKCQFAHGYGELRNLARHPKYKTELCRTFHKIGFCPYGPRCHFVHNFEEARIHNLKVSSQLNQSPPPFQLQPQSLQRSEVSHQCPQSPQRQQTMSTINTNTLVSGLTPLLQPLSVNMSLLEHLASSPQVVAAVAAASATAASSSNHMSAKSLNLATATAAAAAAATAGTCKSTNYSQNLTLHRSNSLGIPPQNQRHHHYQHRLLHIQSRPKPLNLSPTFSLGSAGDSTSPSSSLSQSPTNSMASFFNEDYGLNSCCFPFNPHQEETLNPLTRTPSPLPLVPVSVFECPRLPVFNRISQNVTDLEHLHI